MAAPGADPRQIRFRVSGVDSVELDSHGELAIHAAGAEMRQQKPVIYQGEGESRKEIASGYTLSADNRIGFELGPYDAAKPLVIDPVLVYSTYPGGSNGDARAIAVDSLGNAYVTGRANTADYPTTEKAVQRAFGGGPADAWVAKLSSDGSTLLYCTYIGGSGVENGNYMVVDD